MEEFLLNFCNYLITIIQQFEIQIPDIAFDTKTQIIKLILISPEGQLLTNDKTRAIPKLNLKTRKQGQDFFTDLTNLFTIGILDGKGFRNLKKRSLHLIGDFSSVILDSETFASKTKLLFDKKCFHQHLQKSKDKFISRRAKNRGTTFIQ